MIQKIKYLLFIMVMSACTEEVNFNLASSGTQPVLNAVINPDSSVSAFCFYSQTMGDSEIKLIDNAQIELWENESFIGNLLFSGTKAYRLSYKVKSGNNYTLKLSIPGFPKITAHDSVPFPPEIDSAYYFYATSLDQFQQKVNTAYITLNDNKKTKDYYEIKLVLCASIDSLGFDSAASVDMLKSDDPIIVAGGNLASNPSSYFFSDSLFNGLQHTFSFDFLLSSHLYINGEFVPAPLYCEVRKISKSYFLYRQSWTKQLYTQSIYQLQGNEDFTSLLFSGNTYNIYTNVQNAYGIFAAYASGTLTEVRYIKQ